MGHGDTGAIRTLFAVGKIVPHDLATRALARFAEPDIATLPIGGQAVGGFMGGERNRRLSLPVHALAADFGKFGMADLLGDGAERRAGSDRLQLLVIANENDFRTGLFGFTDEPGKLAASDHARLVDDEDVAAAELVTIVLPAHFP
ncbi:hypothetical protein SAMN05421890_4932 [Ensifer adhaerens]|nr:hypothetical protein SAMN05421890_4932 [Ensifer adhaerens]